MEIQTINENLHHIINVPESLNTTGLYIGWTDKPLIVKAGVVVVNGPSHQAQTTLRSLVERLDVETQRAEHLAHLRAEGVTEVTMSYSGYGDSGQVDSCSYDHEIGDFLWDVMWSRHSGFENNDGGDGTVTWNIVEDTILIEHRDVIQDYEHTTTEL